jgi:hypothetical protein
VAENRQPEVITRKPYEGLGKTLVLGKLFQGPPIVENVFLADDRRQLPLFGVHFSPSSFMP